MEREQALELLPPSYGDAIRLRDAGETAETIAARLGVDLDVVETLLLVGDGKLRRILEAGEDELD